MREEIKLSVRRADNEVDHSPYEEWDGDSDHDSSHSSHGSFRLSSAARLENVHPSNVANAEKMHHLRRQIATVEIPYTISSKDPDKVRWYSKYSDELR